MQMLNFMYLHQIFGKSCLALGACIVIYYGCHWLIDSRKCALYHYEAYIKFILFCEMLISVFIINCTFAINLHRGKKYLPATIKHEFENIQFCILKLLKCYQPYKYMNQMEFHLGISFSWCLLSLLFIAW